jgi:hypothetical protein
MKLKFGSILDTGIVCIEYLDLANLFPKQDRPIQAYTDELPCGGCVSSKFIFCTPLMFACGSMKMLIRVTDIGIFKSS